MNPSNATQQHTQIAPQYFAGVVTSSSSASSILKSNMPASTQQQPTIVTNAAIGNTLIDSTKYVTNGTNYLPVLLTNQTIITSVDPITYQQQQQASKTSATNKMGLASVATVGASSSTNVPICPGNGNKSMVITANPTASNVTYQVLSAPQTNNLNPVIAAPNATVSVLLSNSQPMASAAPIIIRNTTPTITTTNKTVHVKQQPQQLGKQQPQSSQQQQKVKLNPFNQPLNAEILKQIVVGSPGPGPTASLAPGTTLLRPLTQQQPQLQQPNQNKTAARNSSKMVVANPLQQQQHQLQQKQNNQTIITTNSDNSCQMFAALGMELVKTSHTVQKLPQVSLLQNSATKEVNGESTNVLKSSNEIKVGNLNSEVSLIKKPSVSTVDSSLLKTSHKMHEESSLKRKREAEKSVKVSKITSGESCSVLKSNQDSKRTSLESDVTKKAANMQVEKQKSLLKTQNCNKKTTETCAEANQQLPQLSSPRSKRSNSENSQKTPSAAALTANSERRYSEPSNVDSNTSEEKMPAVSQKTISLKSQEVELFFEDEEYLESSGDKLSLNSEKSNDNCIKNLSFEGEEKENAKNTTTKPKEMELSKSSISQETHKELENVAHKVEAGKLFEKSNTLAQEGNIDENSSEDDEVTILPAEEVVIEQIEIDDDDDDDFEKNLPNAHDLKTPDKDQINNASLLCDEQFVVSSSSSISNNSSDQCSSTAPFMKSPCIIDNAGAAPLLKKTLMEPRAFRSKDESQLNGYSTVLDMLSNFNMLNWRERIGTARGTNLKFQLNEFNLIQLYEKNMSSKRVHTAYEKPIYERESSQKKNENGEPITYYNCRRCNVQGPAVDFLAPEFCSLSCLKRDCRKRRDDPASLIRKRNRLSNTSNFAANKKIVNYANETSNASSPPPLTYIRKPKFLWTTYMNRHHNVQAAPIGLFLNPFPTGTNEFAVGMKLEAIDPENCSLFCVCTVVSISGYRLKLTFDGYSNAYDYWVNADSMDIFPPGWCAKTNRILQPPKGIAANKFNWGTYLSKEKAISAPRMLFTHLNSSSLVPHNPFKIGMHLEAEDLNDTGKLCVASVADVLDDRIRIHFDGWDDCYDIIQDINSPYIHPCGWHEGRQQLVVPPDCENTTFNWHEYIRSQGTGEAASEELFAPREPIAFKANMRLEVVDPRNPSLIRPASVVSHKGHRVKLHLDGWPSDYCFWLEDDSPDLHPIGWCDATRHDLEPPPGFQAVKQKLGCPVDGCRGIGNAKNAFKNFHASRDGCPYAAENWRTVVEKPARVNYQNIVKSLPKQGKFAIVQQVPSGQSRLSEQLILERLQMLDNIKTRNVLIQQDKLLTNQSNNILGGLSLSHLKKEEAKETKPYTTTHSTSTSPSTFHTQQQMPENQTLEANIEIAREFLYDYGPRLQQNFNLWQRNFSFDADKIKRNPLKWSTTEVSVFIDLYLNSRKIAALFSQEDIDGQAFLLLQQQDLTECLGLSLGPAVKLYTCILQLRTLAVTKFKVPYKTFSTTTKPKPLD